MGFFLLLFVYTQWVKSPKKQSVNSALKIPCHIVKNSLLQTAAFPRFCSLG